MLAVRADGAICPQPLRRLMWEREIRPDRLIVMIVWRLRWMSPCRIGLFAPGWSAAPFRACGRARPPGPPAARASDQEITMSADATTTSEDGLGPNLHANSGRYVAYVMIRSGCVRATLALRHDHLGPTRRGGSRLRLMRPQTAHDHSFSRWGAPGWGVARHDTPQGSHSTRCRGLVRAMAAVPSRTSTKWSPSRSGGTIPGRTLAPSLESKTAAGPKGDLDGRHQPLALPGSHARGLPGSEAPGRARR